MKKLTLFVIISLIAAYWYVKADPPRSRGRDHGTRQRQNHAPQTAGRTPSLSRSIPHHRRRVPVGGPNPARGVTSQPSRRFGGPNPARGVTSEPRLERSQQEVRRFIREQRVHPVERPLPVQKPQTIGHRRKVNAQRQARVQGSIRRHHPHLHNWFSDDFFDRHRLSPQFRRRGAKWWSKPTWKNVIIWVPWGWSYPIDYTEEGYPYPETTYQEQEEEINKEAEQGSWLALGVFSVGRDETQASYSDMFVQLALGRDGILSGTYYNASTDQTSLLTGQVDKDSQEAVWKLSDDPDSPIVTTGIYNLTQDVAPVRVHFPDGTEQNWMLVRVVQ